MPKKKNPGKKKSCKKAFHAGMNIGRNMKGKKKKRK